LSDRRINDVRQSSSGIAQWVAPIAVGLILLTAWEFVVRHWEIPKYMLPAPSAIWSTAIAAAGPLFRAWLVTMSTMSAALAAAVILGVVAASVFASSKTLERSLFPYAVILQVTPLVAVAPFIVLWIGWQRVWLAQVVCAWIVAFFPILSSTLIGLQSADTGLRDLFSLYGATRWQRLRLLLAPSALPYFLTGLRVSTNLALVGAVVAEFVVGVEVERPGLASTIFASQQRSDLAMMFAALGIISATGVMLFLATQWLSRRLLGKWHEIAISREL
jgi:NitT/TauT family transport system permease protein